MIRTLFANRNISEPTVILKKLGKVQLIRIYFSNKIVSQAIFFQI